MNRPIKPLLARVLKSGAFLFVAALAALPASLSAQTTVTATVLGKLSASSGYPLVQGTDGNFYGVLNDDGSGTGMGKISKLTPAGVATFP